MLGFCFSVLGKFMDVLLQKTQQLTSLAEEPYLPIENRVAYIISYSQSYADNCYAIRTQGIAAALNEHGLDTLCFVRPGRPWDLQADVAPEVRINGVRYIHSPWLNGAPTDEISHLEQSVTLFTELFKVYRPSAVLAASNYVIGLPAFVAAKKLGLPFYVEVRGFGELSRDAREPGYAQTSMFKQEADRDTFVAKQALKVFTLSQTMKAELTKRGVVANKIDLLPNGISDLPQIKPENLALKQKLSIACGEKIVGYIGSFNSYEGLETLIEACEQLVVQGQPIKLLLIGDDQLVTSMGVNAVVLAQKPWLIQIGRVAHQQIADYYGVLDTVVIPRKKLPVCELVPPMKIVEALAYGKRVVVSDVAPLAEYAAKYASVLMFEAGNADSLAKTIQQSLSTPAPQDLHLLPMQQHTSLLSKLLAGQKAGISDIALRPGKCADINLESANYQTASQLFYKHGNLHETLQILEYLLQNKVVFDKEQRGFYEFVKGLARLQNGCKLPSRQPNPGLMTRRKHLLYCLHQSVPHITNGYATRSHGIATGLQQAGWKVNATTRCGFPWDANISVSGKGYHIEKVDGVSYTACAGWSLNKTPLDRYLAETADHFLREAQTSGAEVIVAASNHITALPALLAARRLGLPFIYEVRGLWEVTQASTQPEWMDSDRYHLMKKLESDVASEADLVVTLTEELADELVRRGAQRERIQVVPNAVDAERFTPCTANPDIIKQLDLKAGIPVIGYAGSAVAYEGLELLLEALAELKKAAVDFYFVLVGDGKVIDTVKAKAAQLKIEDVCRFPGRVPFDQVPQYLACMDIMPIPRLSSDVTEMVSPLKPLEAMAMGKAVVLSDVSPHKVFAGNNERARLFVKNNLASLTQTLKELIDHPEERIRLGKVARAWIEQQRTWNHVTNQYGQYIDQLLAQRKPSSDGKSLSQLTLGLIADQFTTDTLASAVNVVQLSPDNWQRELQQHNIDAIFVESAWKGNNGQWHRKVGYYSDEEFAALQALLKHCRHTGIPSLFWNKEDPVHFERFRKTASLCDHVFTTDSRRIIPYLATPEAHTQTASSCPFYASPKIHNLLPSTRKWQHTAAYGGTYYGNRYPERTEYMDKIMSAAAPLGLTIYDRQHSDPDSPYKYPDGLGGYVAGSLSYEEMIQAYKAHPLQINVNSVLDSPTMFSRRVVETAACGSPLLSGPALGMNRYLEGAGHIVQTESDAALALENLLHHPAYRWRTALKGARAIMRAHTTELRLTQMLRTAGMVISAPQPPQLQLLTEEVTVAATQRILAQTHRPAHIVANHWHNDTQNILAAAGISCTTDVGQEVKANSLWLLATPRALEDLEPEDLEDLAWTTVYAPQDRIGYIRDSMLSEGQWPGVALESQTIDAGLQLLRVPAAQVLSNLQYWAQQQPTLALRKPAQAHAQAPNVTPEKTVVIAGHDLKFIKPFYPYFAKARLRILLDFWTSHNQHNEVASKRLLQQADTVFCEWMLGNAIWYGKHKKHGQKLIGRLHAQELRSPLFDKVPFEQFETVIFVGPHMLRNAQKRNAALQKNSIVIYNGVDVNAMRKVARQATNGKVLGFVGMVPQSKRIDLALDILQKLREEDKSYILRIKGKRPEDFAWMKNRPEEIEWYKQQYCRLNDDPLLKGAVIFDSHGNDMPYWYAGIDFVLSTSDFESFHFTIADGAAAGCTPVVLPWEGADELYPKEWVYLSVEAAAKRIKTGKGDQVALSQFAETNFDIQTVAKNMLEIF
ncbi:glycosyltransferase [Rheinheimera soli]|uniref:Glycosyltransferase involved in cell wall biosynthesis n=1 Tax=Rheinheimera soli TaxID=443616 RepID=A0ABU1VUB5_9GAMM|nr:glycosyltransferase [Rheinheimera soli]MDR7119299.1 glycosyltransferase involved in cell wall biosynthesis [Rheinheimera soli]